jgi:hypothetical protein
MVYGSTRPLATRSIGIYFPPLRSIRWSLIELQPCLRTECTGRRDLDRYEGRIQLSRRRMWNCRAAPSAITPPPCSTGRTAGTFGIYVAGNALQNAGWRRHSDDSLQTAVRRAFSVRTDLVFAGSELHPRRQSDGRPGVGARAGIGGQPVLGLYRTSDQYQPARLRNAERFARASPIHGPRKACCTIDSIQQVVSNGNTTNFTACTSAANTSDLCQPDAATPLYTSSGQVIPDISDWRDRYLLVRMISK